MFCKCGNEIPQARRALGYHTCTTCGQLLALQETHEKQKRTGVPWNKGPTMYLGDPETYAKTLKEGGNRKNVPIQHDSLRLVGSSLPNMYRTRSSQRSAIRSDPSKPPLKAKAKSAAKVKVKVRVIGVYILNGERYALREGQQPPKGSQIVLFFPLAETEDKDKDKDKDKEIS